MNEKIDVNVKDLKPFTRFLYTIGELPSSYLLSMTYEEQLIWLCNYLKETVIPTVNNNAEAVEEVQDIVMLMQDYINHYFDNLDVQEEINRKLDSMAEDGTLTNLIKNYVDPLFLSLSNNVNNTLNLQNNKIDEIDAKVTRATSGSPLVASSVSEMTDTTKIYVNTTDGKWYYYTGSEWTIGGTYQATQIGSGAIELNNFSINLNKLHEFKYDFVIGDVNGSNGSFNTTSTNRCRFIKKIWLEAGTLIKFNKGDTNYQYGYYMWDQVANTPIDAHLGWPTYSEIILTESHYYCIRMRKSDNTDITEEEFNDMTSRISIYRPITNRAGQLIDFYSTSNPFVISERYTPPGGVNHNIRFTTNSIPYFMTFENLIQYHNHIWTTTNKRISRRLKYDTETLSNYGTVDTTGSYDMLDLVIPNNYALVLNVLSGIITMKPSSDVDYQDAVLLRCGQGYCIEGAFREIVNYWRFRTIESQISANSYLQFKQKVTNFYGVNKNDNNDVYNIDRIVDINYYDNASDIQSFVFDYANNRILAFDGTVNAKIYNYNGEKTGTLTKPSTGHDNDACYVNGDVYIVGANYNDSKIIYKWNIANNTITDLDTSAIINQEDRNRNVIGGICETAPNSNKLYIVSANSNNTINHKPNDKIIVYEYDINSSNITQLAEFTNDIIYVQGATCINGMLYIMCNTLKENSTYHDGATIKVINTHDWTLIKEIIVDVTNTEPEGATLVNQNGICKLVFGMMGWANTKAAIYTMTIE